MTDREANGRPIPEPDSGLTHGRSWTWARGGHASCAVREEVFGDLHFLHASLRQPGDRPPTQGSTEEDATASIVFTLMAGIIRNRTQEGFTIVSVSERAAVLRAPVIA